MRMPGYKPPKGYKPPSSTKAESKSFGRSTNEVLMSKERRAGLALAPPEVMPNSAATAVSAAAPVTGFTSGGSLNTAPQALQPPAGPEVLQSQIAEARRQAILEKMGYGIDPMAADIPGPGGS